MITLHWIRPDFFWLFVPLLMLVFLLYLQSSRPSASWQSICDQHLQPYVIQKLGKDVRSKLLFALIASLVFIIIGLAGPSWTKLPSATYQSYSPHILLLDMSDDMLATDVSPNRLTRAKFKLQDIFNTTTPGQWALIAYTAEPFVVSPLTSDSQTISALLSSLNMDIMPVKGNQPEFALREAQKLLQEAGYATGELLLLTATPFSSAAISMAENLSKNGIFTSVLPITMTVPTKEFMPFVKAGKGVLVPFTDKPADIQKWLSAIKQRHQPHKLLRAKISNWQDEGRWFILPALLCLLPFFRRGGFACIKA